MGASLLARSVRYGTPLGLLRPLIQHVAGGIDNFSFEATARATLNNVTVTATPRLTSSGALATVGPAPSSC